MVTLKMSSSLANAYMYFKHLCTKNTEVSVIQCIKETETFIKFEKVWVKSHKLQVFKRRQNPTEMSLF